MIKYIGVNDRKTDLFEGQYKIPHGMAYNSYLIIDEKIAIMDSVDIRFAEEWISNIKAALGGRRPDYLIIQHMEPDHSSSVMKFSEEFPRTCIVSSARAFTMMSGYFGVDFSPCRVTVGDGDRLSLGRHELTFFTAPMVHWPEVIVSYDRADRVLFSADSFGKFGALDIEEPWLDEARRYYFGIVSKYGRQVQELLKKLSGLEIDIICSLHGPVLMDNIPYYFGLYDSWSSYRPESEGVCICYTSVYGNTEGAVRRLADELTKQGVGVVMHDLARCDMHSAVADAFRYDRLVLATTTYNGDVFPFMKEFLNHLTERNFQNRFVAFIENGSWAPMANKLMRASLEKSKELKFARTQIKIFCAPSEENREQIKALARELTGID